MDYAQTYAAYLDAVNAALAGHPLLQGDARHTDALPDAPKDGTIPEPLRSAMRYSLLLPGKRLRPVLLLAAYHLLADDWETALPYAAGLEMIHTYSLIHDDLPALDDDALRRGMPTNHLVFGENIAILAGDGLYSLALETMLEAALHTGYPRALSAVAEIARRAGVRGMIAGQTLDVKLEGTQPRKDMVHYIQRHKTGDLLTAPLTAGLLLAGADGAQLQAGETFGEKLGRAFQIVDDLLDLRGDATILGKQTGMDAQRGKMTWPAVYGEDASRREAEGLIREAKEALAPFAERAAFLRELADRTLTRVNQRKEIGRMHGVIDVFSNPIVLCALFAWFTAQILKVPLYYRVEHKLNWKRLVGAGGMPSSHSAMVVALMLSVGFTQGFGTASFGICFVLSMIVMYDAIGVRRETGTQATVINQILKDVLINGHRISDDELKELVGHTPFEVVGGILVGTITTVIYLFVILQREYYQ